MTDDALSLVPRPKVATRQAGYFVLDANTWILLPPGASAAAHDSARLLQEEIQRATGLRVPLVTQSRPAREENVILLVEDPAAADAFLPAAGAVARAAQVAGHGPEAHTVLVTPARIVAGGQGEVALRWAVQTLRQLVRVEGPRLGAVAIADWPTLAYRGIMLDVSRGKVHTLETLREVVDLLALLKMNVLQLYTEHTFVFPHHPRIGEGCGSLSADDILALDAYARSRGVELQPNLQSFGHFAHILNLPEYQHLAETEVRWSLCPTDEGTYALLDDLYADLLPAFSSTTLNVGCDETWDLGKGRSAAEAARIGEGRLYLNHILRLHEIAARYGRRIQLWGDILLHHPELVGELPADVTLLDWHYEAQDDYPSVRLFAESGRPFWVCPGTSSWNTLFPRIENANGNIRTLARLAAEYGAQGLLNTDWGDHGHYQPLGQSFYGYAYGAEQAWTGGTTEDEAFDRALGPVLFGAAGAEVVATIRRLGRLNTLEGMALPNATRSIYALLDEPLAGPAMEALPEATLREVVATCQEAEQVLRWRVAESPLPLVLEEMAFSARLMGYAARKVLASQALRAGLQRLAEGSGDGAQVLGAGLATLGALDHELADLTERFREVWLARARHAEMGISLGHLAGVRARFARARAWLQERLDALQAGRAADYDLAAYATDAEDYYVLGQRERQRWRALGLLR